MGSRSLESICPPQVDALEPRVLLAADLVGEFTRLDLAEVFIPGVTARAAVLVTNVGDARATGQTRVDFYASTDEFADAGDVLLRSLGIKLNLGPEQSKEFRVKFTMPADLEAGTYYILAVIDPDNTIPEETQALAALALNGENDESDREERDNGEQDEQNDEEDGDNNEQDGQNGEQDGDNNEQDGQNGEGDGENVEALGAMAAGGEDNNVVVSWDVYEAVEPQVVLTGEFCDISLGETVLPGAKGKAVLCITNEGNVRALGQSEVEFYASEDEFLDEGDVRVGSVARRFSVGPEQTKELKAGLRIPADMPAGAYCLIAAIDPDGVFGQAEEGSNLVVSDFMFEVLEPQIDLTGEWAGLSLSEQVFPGARGKAEINVANEGNIRAAGRMKVEFYLSDDGSIGDGAVPLGSVTAGGSLRPEQSKYLKANVAIPADTEPGTYYVVAVLDAANAFDESDEDNNILVAEQTVEVIQREPDLAGWFEDIQLDERVSPGSTGSAVVTVYNIGNVRSGGSIVIEMFASKDETFEAGGDVLLGSATRLVNLMPEDSRSYDVSFAFPADIDLDGYFLLAVIDARQAVTDVDRSNNIVRTDFLVQIYPPEA